VKKCKYKIGDWVFVRHKREAIYRSVGADYEWRYYHRLIGHTALHNPSWGQIVGCCRLVEGMREDLGEDGRCFKAEKSYTFWEVRLGMINKPIACAEEDFDYVAPPVPLQLPYSHQEQAPWTETSRQVMREEASKQSRDSRGRWVSAVQVRGRSGLQEGGIQGS